MNELNDREQISLKDTENDHPLRPKINKITTQTGVGPVDNKDLSLAD